MSFIVFENWPSTEEGRIVVDPDSGTNLVFKTKQEAELEAVQCQDGIVVEV